jgi:hypothetical protein
MRVLCIKWHGRFFKVGSTYELDRNGHVFGENNYRSAGKWDDYSGDFIIATELNKALA